ncbi:MAG: hypothetical protein NTZ74_07620 [Chloroflexi bacterium]|nr:hypothetical protein [Chloroflexota bacterium]
MSGAIHLIRSIELILALVILIIASFALQTWHRRNEISDENKKFVKQFATKQLSFYYRYRFSWELPTAL